VTFRERLSNEKTGEGGVSRAVARVNIQEGTERYYTKEGKNGFNSGKSPPQGSDGIDEV